MNCGSMRSLCGVVGWVVLCAGVVSAEKPVSESAKKEEAKWTSLFDGKTLKNWKITDFGGQGPVDVEEGKLIIGMGEPLTGVTWDGPKIPKINYELQCEACRVDGNDFFCGLTFPVGEDPCSLILGGWGGGVIGLSSINGFDASENETTDYYAFEKGKWYPVRLVVTEKRIQAWLDGEKIADVDHTDKEISIRIEVDDCRPLGIATFQTVGAIRDLKMRTLKPTE